MKALFGIVSLLIALAIVGIVARQQLRAIAGPSVRNAVAASEAGASAPTSAEAAFPGAVAADPNGGTVREQARNIQDKVRDDTARALQEGMKRNERADH